jgi:DNA-binding MarR family transcriptional regulator
MAQQLDKTERAALAKVIGIIRAVREEIDPELPAQTLQALLEVAFEPGIAQKDLERKMGVASTTASRIVSRLSEWERHEVPGKDLLVSRKNPLDRRYMVVEPTSKGIDAVRKIIKAAV